MTRVVISNSFKVKYYQKNSNFKAQYNNLHFVIYARYRKSFYETPWWSNIRYKTQMQRYTRCLLKQTKGVLASVNIKALIVLFVNF